MPVTRDPRVAVDLLPLRTQPTEDQPMRTLQLSAFALATLATLAGAAPSAAQDLHPSRRPSPMGMARTTIGEAYLSVVYSRPYQRGRKVIFGTAEAGALVPYGQLWRTGANEATELTVTRNVTVAGKALPAGTYSLFTTPGAERWTVHFNSALGLWGTGGADLDLAATEVLAVEVPTTELAEDASVEQLTLAFEKSENGADLVLRWIRTEVRVPFAVAGD